MDKELFAIMSPTMGKREDIPSILLEKTFTTDNENSCLRYGEIHRAKMRLKELLDGSLDKVKTPDSFPILEYHRFVKRSTGTEYLLLFTKAHIYHWDSSNKRLGCTIARTDIEFVDGGGGEDTITTVAGDFDAAGFSVGDIITVVGTDFNDGSYTLTGVSSSTLNIITGSLTAEGTGDSVVISSSKFACSAFCENWEVVTYNDKVIATNNIDPVLIWDVIPANNFIFLDDPVNGIEYGTGLYLTKAKHLIVFENYLILGYTTENSNVYPQRVRWNAIGNEIEWISGTSGSVEVGKADFLVGFGKYGGYLIVFKEETYYKMWLVPSKFIFNLDLLSPKIGCKSSHSIINDKYGRLFYLASDYTIKEVKLGEVSTLIDKTIKTINPAYAHLIRSTFIDENGEILWAIPSNSTTNNKVISLKDGKWNQYDLAISAFGSYKRQTGYTWNNLTYSTWNSWGWDKWNIQEADIGFKVDLGADFSGYTYALHANEKDDEEDYSGFFVLSTDLYDKRGLSFYKRLEDLNLYFRRETAGSMTIEIKGDNEMDWQSAGTVSLSGNEYILVKHLPVDYRAKHFLIKISGENRYRFIGIMFSYIPIGER